MKKENELCECGHLKGGHFFPLNDDDGTECIKCSCKKFKLKK